jgi:hypothetical protein
VSASRVDTVVADRPELVLTWEEREILAGMLAELLLAALGTPSPAEVA